MILRVPILRLACVVCILAGAAGLVQSAHAATDTGPSAFDGIVWGASLEDLDGVMVPADRRPDDTVRFFRRKDKEYRPAGLEPVPAVFAFYQDALRGVYIQPQSAKAAESMLTSLRLEYGEAERWTRFGVSYARWRLGRLIVTHKADRNTGKFRIAYIHLPSDVAAQNAEGFIETLNQPAVKRGYW